MPSCISNFSRRRCVRNVFLGLWCAMLAMPLFLKTMASVLGFPRFRPFPKYENREPATFPRLHETPLRELGSKIDSWYSDNFAFRTDIVGTFRKLLYQWLRTPVGREVPGKGDWVFRRGGPQGDSSWAELDDYLGAFELTEDELDAWRTFLEGRCEWARAHGAFYLEMITSVKAQIHTEKLPAIIRAHQGRNVSAQIQEALRGSPAESHVLFMGDALRAVVASGRDAYYHEDHHPAPYGMWVHFDMINRRLQQDFPNIGTIPFYEDEDVPENVRTGTAPGCYPDPNGRLMVSNPGTSQFYDPTMASSRRFPYTNVSTTNEMGGISMLIAHDSFLRFTLSSWRGKDGDVKFPFGAGIGRVDARIFMRFTTGSLTHFLTERIPDVILEQFPECRLNMNMIGYDETMRRAAAFARATPLDPNAQNRPQAGNIRVLATFENVATPADYDSSHPPVARLYRDKQLCGEESVFPGVRRAIYFAPIQATETSTPSDFRLELVGSTAQNSRVEVRLEPLSKP